MLARRFALHHYQSATRKRVEVKIPALCLHRTQTRGRGTLSWISLRTERRTSFRAFVRALVGVLCCLTLLFSFVI
jgi:hypothetical protein